MVKKKSDLFFLYGFEGTGKKIIWNIIYAAIRGLDKIIINIASNGITTPLLESGRRTTHSLFDSSKLFNQICSIYTLHAFKHHFVLFIQRNHNIQEKLLLISDGIWIFSPI